MSRGSGEGNAEIGAGIDQAFELALSETAPADSDAPATPAASEPESPPASVTDSGVPAPAGQDPAGKPEAPQAAPAAPVGAPTAPVASPPEQPYVFRDGLHVPGATLTADGAVRIPKESVQYVERIAANLSATQRANAQLQRQLQETGQQRSAKETQAQAVLDKLSEIARWSPEQQVQWWAGYHQQLPVMLAQAEAKHAREELERSRQQYEPIQQQQQWQEAVPLYREAVGRHIQQFIQADATLTGIDAATMLDKAWEWAEQGLIRTADRDIPEAGIRRGDPAVDLGLLRRLLATEAGYQRQLADARKATEQARITAQAQQQAAQTNAAALRQPVAVPKAPAAAPTPKQARDDHGRYIKGKQDFDREWETYNPLADT